MSVQTLNVRLPKEVVDWIDTVVKRGIYKNRSEAIRDFSRQYLVEKRYHQ